MSTALLRRALRCFLSPLRLRCTLSPLRLRYTLLPVACGLLLTCPLSFAQVETATLSGVVTDPKGAVVPDVDVTATRIETGTVLMTKTNGAGIYFFTGLMPGHYHLVVHKLGFKEIAIKEIELHVQDKVERNFSLEIGSVSESVTVTGEIPLLNTQDAAVSTVVDRQFVESLPLNGRSFQSLFLFTPGLVFTPAGASPVTLERGQFSVNGQRADANYFTIDGVGANIGTVGVLGPGGDTGAAGAGGLPGLSALGGTNNLVSLDALDEYKILTSTYAAEFGRTPGGQVTVVTRSGTNEFHGSAFEYFRNEKLDANDWFNNARGLRKPALRNNDFGGVLGGPILKNRTFFFFSYEGLRLRLPQSVTADVPSLAARQAAPAGVGPILNAYPLPNGPDRIDPATGRPNGFAVYNASFSEPSSLNATSIRIDQALGSRAKLFGRYNYAPSEGITRAGGSQAPNSPSHFQTTTQTVTLGATLSITPGITNDLRVNYSRNTGNEFSEIDDLGGATVPPEAQFFPSGRSSQTDRVGYFISTGAAGARTVLVLGPAAENRQRQFNLVDSLSLVRGSHLLKFGADYRLIFPVVAPQQYLLFVQFRGVGNPDPAAPASDRPPGSALSGIALNILVQASADPRFPRFHNISFYGQDTWKMRQRLTLTYGLRWEINPAPSEANGNDALSVIGLDNPATSTLAPRGTSLWETTYNNLAPRVAIAYLLRQRPGGETVLRGGFGIFYDLGYGPIADAFGGSYPFTGSKFVSGPPFPLSPSDAAPPAPTPLPSGNMTVSVADLKLPRTYQWNLAVEQALGTKNAVSISYVAAAGRSLLRQESLWGTAFGGSLNPAVFDPLMLVSVTRNKATSDYHAMQLQFQRRLSRGLQALASYTWSKSLDISSSSASLLGNPFADLPPKNDRGPSDFDVRHAFSGAVTYDIPTPRTGSVGKAILGHWSADTIFFVRSATPVNIRYGAQAPFGPAVFRPDLVLGAPLYLDDSGVAGGRRINPNAFAIPPIDPNTFISPRQGTLGRNVLRGFSAGQIDFAVRRQFNLTERVNLQFRAEFFNVFNHPNFGDPDPDLDFFAGFAPNPNFGVSQSMLGRSLGQGGSSGGFNPLYQIGGPRSIQFSLKLKF